uniref:Uncharacterized protein n=1 Tax=Parascaris equorum TaxID=6256 RepID=A0A914S4X5_PAREQ
MSSFTCYLVAKKTISERDHSACTKHDEDQDHRSTREKVLCLDWRIHPRFPFYLPTGLPPFDDVIKTSELVLESVLKDVILAYLRNDFRDVPLELQSSHAHFNVDLETGIRRIRTIYRPSEMLLSKTSSYRYRLRWSKLGI